ncbi:MAG: nuclear transport factor 2 family protein, partial [Nocardioides sp.]
PMLLAVTDSARAIENLLHTYALRIDAGDLDGVADLFAYGRILGQEDGPPESVFEGRDGVRAMYEMATRLYDDGTPKTKHVTTNSIIEVDEETGTASAQSTYLVTQATADLALQVIITGHYRDTFQRLADAGGAAFGTGHWWFDSRTMYVDQVGDLSHHLKW